MTCKCGKDMAILDHAELGAWYLCMECGRVLADYRDNQGWHESEATKKYLEGKNES